MYNQVLIVHCNVNSQKENGQLTVMCQINHLVEHVFEKLLQIYLLFS